MMAVMVMLYTTVFNTKMKMLMAGQGTVAERPKASGYLKRTKFKPNTQKMHLKENKKVFLDSGPYC